MPSAAPAVLLHSLHTQQGVCNIVIAMTRRDFVKPAFSLRKKRFVKTHALSLLGTTRLLSRSGSCVGRACFLCPTFPRSNTAKALRFIQHHSRNDSTRCRKACIFTPQTTLRENTCPIASGDYSTPVSQRTHRLIPFFENLLYSKIRARSLDKICFFLKYKMTITFYCFNNL